MNPFMHFICRRCFEKKTTTPKRHTHPKDLDSCCWCGEKRRGEDRLFKVFMRFGIQLVKE